MAIPGPPGSPGPPGPAGPPGLSGGPQNTLSLCWILIFIYSTLCDSKPFINCINPIFSMTIGPIGPAGIPGQSGKSPFSGLVSSTEVGL